MTNRIKLRYTALCSLLLVAGLSGCNQQPGGGNQANADVQRLEQQVAAANAATEKALTHNTVLQSRLKALQSAAAEKPPTVEKAVVEEVVAAPSDQQTQALQAQVETLSTERDRLQELLQENEDALRESVAAKAEQQQAVAVLEQKLVAAQQHADEVDAALAAAQKQIDTAEQNKATDNEAARVSVAQMASLKEQLVAVQADKNALEKQISMQDQQIEMAGGSAEQASGRIAALEQSLTAARAHGHSLAEQLAAIQADTRELEAKLIAADNRLQAAAKPQQVANSNVGVSGGVPLAAALAEQERLRERATTAEQRALDMGNQLKGAVAQAKAQQDQMVGLKRERDALEQELAAMETELPEAADDTAVAVDSSGLEVKDALDIQTLLEEGQQLLEACNASLGAGAHEMFEMEQQQIGMKNALQRQRRVTAARCGRLSTVLKRTLAENRRMRAALAARRR